MTTRITSIDRLRPLTLLLAGFTLLLGPPAWSLSNESFESGFTAWQGFGDASIDDTSVFTPFGSAATDGSMQLMLSTLPNNGITPLGPLGPAGPYSGNDALGEAALEAALGLTLGTIDGYSPSANTAVEGSGVYQEFTASDNTTISFDWNFLTNEPTPTGTYTDFFFWALVPSGGGAAIDGGSLMDTSQGGAFSTSAATDFSEETGYQTTNINIALGGNYRLVLGVVDVQDDNYTSGVLVDNFSVIPEPSTGALVFLGLAGMAWLRRTA